MKEALYREYLLLLEDKKITSFIKNILLVFFIATALIVIIKNQSILAFVIAITIGQITSVFTKDDKNGSLAILKTMPIKSYKYIIARYISVFTLFVGIVIILTLSESLAGVITNIDLSSEDEFLKFLNIFVILVLINIYIPGYYKFGSKSFKTLLLIGFGAAAAFGITYYIAYNSHIMNYSYNILIAIGIIIVVTAISILLSIRNFKNRDL